MTATAHLGSIVELHELKVQGLKLRAVLALDEDGHGRPFVATTELVLQIVLTPLQASLATLKFGRVIVGLTVALFGIGPPDESALSLTRQETRAAL